MVRRTVVPKVQKLKTQKKQKVIGQVVVCIVLATLATCSPPRYKQPQYLGEIRKRDPKL